MDRIEMRATTRWTTLVALALAGLLPGGCYYQLEGDFDPYRCDPACSGGKICHQGKCVFMDSRTADGPQVDTNPDGPLPDVAQPDASAPDGGQPDQGLPDGPTPDTAPPDMAPPDTAPPDTAPPDMAPPDTAPPDTGVVVPGTWVTIPPAGTALPVTFSMGSPTSEPCRGNNEDQHPVTLTHQLEITAHEVTQGEFLALMGYNPAKFPSCGTDCPVEYVNWHEAAAYCNALSTKAGLASCYSCSGTAASVSCSEATSYTGQKVYDCPGYRLPTEAEWEYAYRAGSNSAFYPSAGNNGTISSCAFSDANAGKIGWYHDNAGSTPHPKGLKAPNAWGLYDMAGNVHEWCHDWYQANLGSSAVTDPWGSASGTGRLVRGGSWGYPAADLRAARRLWGTLTTRYDYLGFRCARTK
jgi:formylglycine-generating enzyme required for sulfatase activity